MTGGAAEPNRLLRAARERTPSTTSPGEGLSRQELADVVNAWLAAHRDRAVALDANYVGKLERGLIRWPQVDYRSALRDILGVSMDADLGFRRPRRPTPAVAGMATVDDVDRQEFLRVALGVGAAAVAGHPLARLALALDPTPVPAAVGAGEIAEIRTAARLFATWDHTYGGGLVREAVAAQLRYSAALLETRCAPGLRPELFSAVGQLGHVTGFMAFDAAAHADAERMFRFALACAEEATDWHLRAKVLSSMARQAIWVGDPDTGLTLTELALVRADRLTATERAMLLAARARALAKLHRVQDTLTSVGLADEAFTDTDPSLDPPWMGYHDHAQHAGDTGHALFDLAVDGRFVAEANSRLATAVDGHTDAYARSRGISGVKLASLTMVTGDPHQAVVIADHAAVDLGMVRSRRAAQDMDELHQLAARHDDLDDVADLRRRLPVLVAGAQPA